MTKVIRIVCMTVAAVLLQHISLQAQNNWNLEYWQNPNLYTETQNAVFLDLIGSTLDKFPPSLTPSLERKLALYNLDAVLHTPRPDTTAALKSYMEKRTDAVIADLDKPVSKGIRIYKIYNDGFIVRSKSATVAFDICSRNGSLIPSEQMERLVKHCDVMFLSHNHSDHSDRAVVSVFNKLGIPVYAPENFWPENKEINHIRYTEIKDLHVGQVDVKVLPGHQDDLINNIHVVRFPEGFTVAHLGDQYNKDDLAWLKDVNKKLQFKKNGKKYRKLDVLIIDCWIHDMNEHIKDFDPNIIVTGHENELGHTIDHREAFWLTYYKMEEVVKPDAPYLIMSWGEWYNYGK